MQPKVTLILNTAIFNMFKAAFSECEKSKIQKHIRYGCEEYVSQGRSSRVSGKGKKYRKLYNDIEATTGILLSSASQSIDKFIEYNELVHKKLLEGSLDENFAFAIYFWLHAYDTGKHSKYAKGIDTDIIADHSEPHELKSNLEKIVKRLPLEGFIELPSNVASNNPLPDAEPRKDITTTTPTNEAPPPSVSVLSNFLSPHADEETVDNKAGIDIYAYNDDWTIEKFLNPLDPTGFIGREAELKRLDDFANDSRNFVFWAIAGSSGSGKTKLYTAWMNKLGSAVQCWDPVMVDRDTDTDYFKDKWQPGKPTLFIIDYIFGYGDEFRKILNHSKRPLNHKVRLLIVDHVFPKKLEDLHEDWRFGYDHTEYWKSKSEGSSTRLATIFFDTKQTALRLEEANAGDQEHIVETIMRRLAPNATETQIEEAKKYLRHLSDGADTQRGNAWQPLFAGLVGDALHNNRNYHSLNRRVLIEEYLDSAKRLPWRRKELEAKIASVFIAVATALRGLNYDVLAEGVKAAIPQNFDGHPVVKMICERVVTHTDEFKLVQFEPDMLGETYFLFLLKALEKNELSAELKQSFYSTLSLGSKQNQNLGAFKFLGFMENLTRNLGNDKQDNKACEYWEILLTFLNPENFSEKSVMRWAVSIVLMEIFLKSNSAGFDSLDIDYGNKFLDKVNLNDLSEGPKHLISRSFAISLLYLCQKPEALSFFSKKFTLMLNEIIDGISIKEIKHFFECACKSGSLELVTMLFREFGKICLKEFNPLTTKFDQFDTRALISAGHGHHLEVVKFLCDEGGGQYINSLDAVDGPPLLCFCRNDDLDLVKLLIKKGADVNRTARDDFSALMQASFTCQLQMVKLLIEEGAYVNHIDLQCYTALTYACNPLLIGENYNDPLKVVMYLGIKGADYKCVDYNGNNLLSIACIPHARPFDKLKNKRIFMIVKYLLKKGVSANHANKLGKTAIDYAREYGHTEIVDLFLNYPESEA